MRDLRGRARRGLRPDHRCGRQQGRRAGRGQFQQPGPAALRQPRHRLRPLSGPQNCPGGDGGPAPPAAAGRIGDRSECRRSAGPGSGLRRCSAYPPGRLDGHRRPVPAGRAGSVADRWADRRRAGALAPDRGRCAALHLEQCLHGDRGCHRLRTGHGPVETPSAHHRLLGGGLPGELAALLRTGLPGEPASLPRPDLRIPQRPAHRLLGASTRLQDTFGFRCAAQVTAPVLDQIWQLREAAEVEINSAPETRTRHDATWGHRLRPCVAGTASATLRERAPTRSSGPARWRNTPRAVATRRGSRPAPRRSR